MQDEVHVPKLNSQSRNNLPWMILAVVVAAAVILGVVYRGQIFGSDDSATTAISGKASGYQAVFLTNGQVYFGKLSSAHRDYVELSDIYYLQVTQPPLQGSAELGQAAAQQQARLQLVKLGNELHGPVDEMQLNREHILFFEDLKEEGKVVQAIREYQKNPTGSTTQTPAAQTPAATPVK